MSSTAIASGYEKELIVLGGVQRSKYCRFAGIANRTGRQAFIELGIIGLRFNQIFMRYRARKRKPVLHGGGVRRLHFDLQAVPVHSWNRVALLWKHGFRIDDTCKRT